VDPQNFPLEANLYQKLRFFAIFEAVYRPTFLSQNDEIWYAGADIALPPSVQSL